MSRVKQKKKRLFDLFSQNLEWVKEHPSITFEPDFSNGYICPICLDVFFKNDLESSAANPLTFEDIPPAALGGKPLALTCKKCNSESGHMLDSHLLKRLLETDSALMLPNSKTKATFEQNGHKINGTFAVNSDGGVNFNFLTGNSNPIQAKQFMQDFATAQTMLSPLFHMKELFDADKIKDSRLGMHIKIASNERRAEIALLRIGYLLAFANLGNGFLINSGLYKVREQILYPDKVVLPNPFWLKYEFPKELEGVNIVARPRELQCFLIVFRVKTNSRSRQFAIVLPGPSNPGINVYDFIKDELCVGDGSRMINTLIVKIPPRDYLHRKEDTFISTRYWQKVTSNNYQPEPGSDK
jgi:hypothetical protein